MNMRILYLSPPKCDQNGISDYASEFSSALMENGIKVVHWDELGYSDIRYDSFIRWRSSTKSLHRSLDINRLNSNFDLLHIELGQPNYREFYTGLALISAGLTIPIVLTIHDTTPRIIQNPCRNVGIPDILKALRYALNETVGRHNQLGILRRAARIFVLGELARDRIATYFGKELVDKVVVIPHGRNLPDMPSASADEPMALGFFGFLFEVKGVHLLLDALAELRKMTKAWSSDLRLDIFGDIPQSRTHPRFRRYIDSLHDRCSELGITDAVTFHGRVPEERFPEVFTSNRIFAFPYLDSNPASGAILHAMAHGVAIVASRTPASTSAIEDGKSGLLVTPGNVSELVQTLSGLLDSPVQIRYLGMNARHRIEEVYSWPKVIPQVIEQYEKILQITPACA